MQQPSTNLLLDRCRGQTVIQRKPLGDEESTSGMTSEKGLRSLEDSSLRYAPFRMTLEAERHAGGGRRCVMQEAERTRDATLLWQPSRSQLERFANAFL